MGQGMGRERGKNFSLSNTPANDKLPPLHITLSFYDI